MRVLAQAFWLPKAGNTEAEYEDAYCPVDLAEERPTKEYGELLRFAVADGATETSFSGRWAALLTRAYRRGHIRPNRVEQDLLPLQKAWRKRVTRKPLPWYAEEKLGMGAASSILGLTLIEQEGSQAGSWEALSVGDSCVFHVRGDHLLCRFPVAHSSELGSRPVLLSSMPDRNGSALASVATREGTWEAADELLLMTDALAGWFLGECERDEQPWRVLRGLGRGPVAIAFPEWVAMLRERGAMKNDDVTLLRISLG